MNPVLQNVRDVLAEIAARIEKLEEENARLRGIASESREAMVRAAQHFESTAVNLWPKDHEALDGMSAVVEKIEEAGL